MCVFSDKFVAGVWFLCICSCFSCIYVAHVYTCVFPVISSLLVFDFVHMQLFSSSCIYVAYEYTCVFSVISSLLVLFFMHMQLFSFSCIYVAHVYTCVLSVISSLLVFDLYAYAVVSFQLYLCCTWLYMCVFSDKFVVGVWFLCICSCWVSGVFVLHMFIRVCFQW